MSDHQISTDELLKLSDALVPQFFTEHDFYSLLVLSLITVTQYSTKKYHLTTDTRIDLAMDIVPDLIKHLSHNTVISLKTESELTAKNAQLKDEVHQILRAYIYASSGLRTKSKEAPAQGKATHSCFGKSK